MIGTVSNEKHAVVRFVVGNITSAHDSSSVVDELIVNVHTDGDGAVFLQSSLQIGFATQVELFAPLHGNSLALVLGAVHSFSSKRIVLFLAGTASLNESVESIGDFASTAAVVFGVTVDDGLFGESLFLTSFDGVVAFEHGDSRKTVTGATSVLALGSSEIVSVIQTTFGQKVFFKVFFL